MLVLYFAVFFLACLNPTLASRGDEDQQIGQVPVKESPPYALNNVTFEVLDFSRNKGCKGKKCSSYRDGQNRYSGEKSGRGGSDEDEEEDDYEVCSMRREYGNCRGRRMRWHFNSREGECRRFVYSGCGGNENNFRSRRRCESECGDNEEDDY